MERLMRFEGRVALITGASTGIGLATINRLILEGCRVFGAHRRKAAEIDIGRATSVHLDVTNELNWNAAIDQVLAEVGRLDILINNAGIRESASIEDTSLSLWHHLIDTNLTSTFLGCRAVVSAMRKGGGGAIVNVGSITGIRGTENMVAYSASKSGIVSFTSSLALDLAPSNIRVNAPGLR